MPKQRQIPCLFARKLADGQTMWHWKPSARLRRAGFVNVKLGYDHGPAVIQAMELNAQVVQWDKTGATGDGAAVLRPAPRVVRFAELMARYRASDAFTTLRASSRREYDTRLRQLDHWAMDGQLPVRDIDKQLVRDLRNGLVSGHSIHRAASTLAVLRLLLAWAVREGIVRENAAVNCDIPERPSRRNVMNDAVMLAIVAAARRLKLPEVELGIDLAFWSLQRQADILALNRLAWREYDNVDRDHAALLANPRGRVMGFRLCQQKTAVWIDAPMPPQFHDRVETALSASPTGFLFQHPDDASQPMPDWMFQRRFKAARTAAAENATMAGNNALAEQINQCQFRDLRRTGMTFYSNMGARLPWITALSGHAVLGRKTILDTYMPGNTEGACACVATGIAGLQRRADREEQA
ncbi:phage integrase SAM-like domain-containing protein [Sphingomonas alpina]|uniref:Phage integrase SAM-like domain-containing protein n=1 Tax=Sphingomonas alpina TaxID=653931 RepID=A0A7H0LHZ1_9SPHN|nr:phage integrase SAM-like domain-containing protein [Sphingomonas alpina]QNQ09294.1 phage integrase SAM-like domain-containing protein [Sphingomonas alpina]